jgi:hypothetical protein
MASELRVNTLKDASGNNSIGVSYVASGSTKSWLNYDQKDTITIRDSFNVASVADDGSGAFTPAYTSNMANGNYASHMCSIATTSNLGFNRLGSVANTQAGSCQYVHYENSNGTDTDLLTVSVDGDLA